MVDKASAIWANGPSNSPYEPDKEKIREWGTWVETTIDAYEPAVTVTVGSGGEFPTINAAIERLSLLRGPRYKKNGVKTTIVLKSGFVVEEQVVIVDLDMGYVTIDAEDAEVAIRRSALSQAVDSLYFPTFAALGVNSVLPVIDALFNMDTSGSGANRNGIFLSDGARGHVMPGAGVKNAGGRGLHVANGSICKARSSIFTGAGEAGARVANALCELRASNLSGGYKGLMTAGAAVTDLEDANVSNSTFAGIENYDSIVRFGGGFANNCQIALLQFSGLTTARMAQFNDSVGNAIELREGARANLRSTEIKRAGNQAVYSSGSEVFLGNANLDDATGSTLSIEGGRVDAPGAVLTNAGGYAVNAINGAYVNIQGADATGAFGSAGNGVAFMTTNGCFINATSAIGTPGRTANTLSRHGAIFTL